MNQRKESEDTSYTVSWRIHLCDCYGVDFSRGGNPTHDGESTSNYIAVDPLYYHSPALKKEGEIRGRALRNSNSGPKAKAPQVLQACILMQQLTIHSLMQISIQVVRWRLWFICRVQHYMVFFPLGWIVWVIYLITGRLRFTQLLRLKRSCFILDL